MERRANAAAARNAARGVSPAHSLFGVRHSQAYTAKNNYVNKHIAAHERKNPRTFKARKLRSTLKTKGSTLRNRIRVLKAKARTLRNHIRSHNAQNVDAMLELEGIQQELDSLRKI